MRVLMLDCAGFVGSRLLARLLEQPDVEVIGIASEYQPVSQFLSHERLTFYGGELPPDLDLMQRLVTRADVTVNLIATADAKHHRDDVNAILDVDLPASLVLARACARAGSRLIQISSGDVYDTPGLAPGEGSGTGAPALGTVVGAPGPPASLEEGAPADACTLYASGKRLLELGVQTSGATLGLNYTVLRLFNAVGPGCEELADWCPRHPAPLFAQLVRGIVREEPMEFSIDPEAVHTFLHVDDAVDCIADVILDPPPASARALYNIGNPDNATTPAALARQLFARYAQRFGVPSQATVTWTAPPGNGTRPAQRIPDIARAVDELHWSPQRGLDEIVDGALEAMLTLRWRRRR